MDDDSLKSLAMGSYSLNRDRFLRSDQTQWPLVVQLSSSMAVR